MQAAVMISASDRFNVMALIVTFPEPAALKVRSSTM
jgi:hypothetical protein